jgi:hypothetical protein
VNVLSFSFVLWKAGNVWCKTGTLFIWFTENCGNVVSTEDSASSDVYLKSVSLIELEVLFEKNDTLQHGNIVILCYLRRSRERLMWRSCSSSVCYLVLANKTFDEFILILYGGLSLKFRQSQFLATLTHNQIHKW